MRCVGISVSALQFIRARLFSGRSSARHGSVRSDERERRLESVSIKLSVVAAWAVTECRSLFNKIMCSHFESVQDFVADSMESHTRGPSEKPPASVRRAL